MDDAFDPGALLGDSFPLGDGTRVRLRLARWADAEPIARLIAGSEHDPGGLVARLVQFDPRERLVLCATTLLDGRETLVGVGEIALAPGSESETLVVDPRMDPGLRELLAAALCGRSRVLVQARAA